MCRSTDLHICMFRSTDLYICMCRSTDLHICMFRSTDLYIYVCVGLQTYIYVCVGPQTYIYVCAGPRFGRCAGRDSSEWLASGYHNQGLQSFVCLTRLQMDVSATHCPFLTTPLEPSNEPPSARSRWAELRIC